MEANNEARDCETVRTEASQEPICNRKSSSDQIASWKSGSYGIIGGNVATLDRYADRDLDGRTFVVLRNLSWEEVRQKERPERVEKFLGKRYPPSAVHWYEVSLD